VAVARRDDPRYLKEADALADLARSRNPKSFDVLIIQAMIRHLQERYEEEVALYREVQTLNAPSVVYLNNLAWSLSEALRKPEEALQIVDTAIKRAGRAAQFLDTRGVILTRLGRFQEAIADLELSVKAQPSPVTYFHLARAYFKAGKAEDFRRCRDLARQQKFDPSTLDSTDRADLDEVMSRNP
jgi:tetratricopeptide (TPR) repeat protein